MQMHLPNTDDVSIMTNSDTSWTSATVHKTRIELLCGDITQQDTDAIVNAANNSLLGGGGVDGAIHYAAGPELLAETRTLGGCQTGDAKISGGYRLKARHVIHTVGPVYQSGSDLVPRLLASAYRRSLQVAQEHGLHSLAFPSISTGVYGYPMHEAAPVALRTVIDFVKKQEQLTLIRFVLYNPHSLQTFAEAFAQVMAAQDSDTPDTES